MINYILILILIILFVILLLFTVNNNNNINNVIKIIEENTKITTTDNNSKYRIIIYNKNMFKKIIERGSMGLAESYMDGDWDANNLEAVLYELLSNEKKLTKKLTNFKFLLYAIKNKIISNKFTNTIKSSKKNISHHYDIGNDLYIQMLDKNMQYTCAYFYKPNLSLDEAQLAKMELIAKKLKLTPGLTILDIGCGFGALGHYLVTKYNVNVVGVTLSENQKEYADTYFQHPNLKIHLLDYRKVTGSYDRVYSIGCLEHIGKQNYNTYFDKCYSLLKKNGIMLIHTIGANNYSNYSKDFINTYIFPEAEVPHLNDLTKPYIMNKWNLEHIQNIGLSYNKTLRAWYKNLDDWSNLPNYNERFKRMWKYYLLSCAAGFRFKNICLWQIVYTKRNSNIDNCNYIVT